MKLLGDLPDELILCVANILGGFNNAARAAPKGCFDYDSDVLHILKSAKLKDLIRFSFTCQRFRLLVINTIRLHTANRELQLSLARSTEVPDLVEFKNFKTKGNRLAVPPQICMYSVSSNVTHLEFCLNFIDNPATYTSLVLNFKNISVLKILGNTECYVPAFEYIDSPGRFSKLKKLYFPLPASSLAFKSISASVPWHNLSELSIFFDPFANFTIHVIEEVMKALTRALTKNDLQTLHVYGGNQVIFNNFTLLIELSELVNVAKGVSSFSISHGRMKTPDFLSVGYRYGSNDDNYGYDISPYGWHDFASAFKSIFRAIRDLPRLRTLTLDMDMLRLFHEEFEMVFKEVQFGSTCDLELILCEPAFFYPITTEQALQISKLILTVQPSSLSFKLGLQIEMIVSNYIILMIQLLLNRLTTKFNYTRIKWVEYELCWSIMEDSYIREHNEIHEEKLLRWQRPPLASSVYKHAEAQRIHYSGYEPQDVDYVKLMNSALVPFETCTYIMTKQESDDMKRLKFWEIACTLKDYITFSNLGNRKGSIFDT